MCSCGASPSQRKMNEIEDLNLVRSREREIKGSSQLNPVLWCNKCQEAFLLAWWPRTMIIWLLHRHLLLLIRKSRSSFLLWWREDLIVWKAAPLLHFPWFGTCSLKSSHVLLNWGSIFISIYAVFLGVRARESERRDVYLRIWIMVYTWMSVLRMKCLYAAATDMAHVKVDA